MNKRPVSYLQTDRRWGSKNVAIPAGGSMNIGRGGCGPTCAAMLISTLKDPAVTPLDTMTWAAQHGHLEANHGTNYVNYFQNQFKAFGISCGMLNWVDTYGRPGHSNHQKAVELLKDGYYLIALMNKGLWTSGGHFIVVWWADEKIRINDPVSTKDARVNGDPATFFSQVKYYWWVDAREYNKEEEDMTGKEIYDKLTEYANGQPLPDWARKEFQEAIDAGITDGSNPMGLIPRYQAALMALRASKAAQGTAEKEAD